MTAEEIEMVVNAVLEKAGVVMKTHPDAPLPAQEYYSIKTCAYVSGVSPDHIRRAVVGGTLVASDLGTKDHPLYRIHRDNLVMWTKEREHGAKPPAKDVQYVSRYHKPPRRSSKASA